MVEDDGVIRAKRIELVDEDGDARVIIDGSGFDYGFVGIAARGEDGTTTTFTLGAADPTGPYLRLEHGGAFVTVGFDPNGKPLVSTREAGGEERRITPE